MMKWNWPSWWSSQPEEKGLQQLTAEANVSPKDAVKQRALLPELNMYRLATSFGIFQVINKHVTLKRKRMNEDLTIKVLNDIIYDIFLRLPVKSLLRFKSISKEYCNIIDSLDFANMHMMYTRDTYAQEYQLLPPRGRNFSENIVHSYTYDGREIRKSDHPVMEFSWEDHGYVVETVAYGLLLFRNPRQVGEVFLYNILRGEVLELPRPLGALTENDLAKEGLAVYGIGFDNITNSYKIVRACRNPMSYPMDIDDMIMIPPFTLSDQLRFETEVYTLGTSSWRVISSSVCFPLIDDFNSWERDDRTSIRGVSAYGDMHWKCYDSENQKQRIMSFDFEKEEFKDAPLPNFGWQQMPCKQQLFNLKGSLAVFSFPSQDECIDIWVLKDYEKKEWVREYRITDDKLFTSASTNNIVIHESGICLCRHLLTPVGVCGHGGVVFEYPHCLFVLDIRTNQILRMERPQSYISHARMLSCIGNILCLGNFGHLSAGYPPKYRFLKTGRRVYVAT